MNLTTKSFTYGFEIEGVFERNLLDSLPSDTEIKEDGSIDWARIMIYNKIPEHKVSCSDETEVNLGVFNDLDELSEKLSLFKNGKTYWQDDRCGLHLHIKPKKDIKITKGLFWDIELIKKLEEFAFNKLCSCIKLRENNRFCESYDSFGSFYRDFKRNEKYRFVRNHPSGTMEFRFFCPCQHKVKNVEKFIEYMIELLNKQEAKKSISVTLQDNFVELATNFRNKISTEIKDNNYSYKLGSKINTFSPYESSDEEDDEDDDDQDESPY